MSFDIQYIGTSGITMYSLLFNESKQVYRPSTDTYTTYADSSIDNFDLPLTEDNNRRGYYNTVVTGDTPAQIYTIEIYRQIGGSPDKDSDILKAAGEAYWNGTGFVDNLRPPQFLGESYIGEVDSEAGLTFRTTFTDRFGRHIQSPNDVNYTIYSGTSTISGASGTLTYSANGTYFTAVTLSSFALINAGKAFDILIDTEISGQRVETLKSFSTIPSNIISGSTLQLSDFGILTGAVSAGGITATGFVTNLSSTIDDHFNGGIIRMTDGDLTGQARIILDYNGTSKRLTLNKGFSQAPNASDSFIVWPIGGELGVS